MWVGPQASMRHTSAANKARAVVAREAAVDDHIIAARGDYAGGYSSDGGKAHTSNGTSPVTSNMCILTLISSLIICLACQEWVKSAVEPVSHRW